MFGLVALAHLLRVVYQMPVCVGDWAVPMWLSWGGVAVADALCAWAIVGQAEPFTDQQG